MIASTLLLSLVLVTVLAVTVVVDRSIGPDPETRFEPCRNCAPETESESDRYYCVVCRPEIGVDYPPERY